MVAIGVGVEATGPLFDGRAPKMIQDGTKRTIRRLVELGTQRLDAMLRPRPKGVFLSVAEAAPGKASTGNYRRNVNPTFKGMNARIDDGGVVYGPWLESGQGRGGTRFKGYFSFRRVSQWLNKQKPKVLQSVFGKTIKDLNGGL